MDGINESKSEVLLEELTWREQEVLELLTEHLTNREIASRLYLAESTIKEYVGNILGKLHVDNRRQAVKAALSFGLIDPNKKLEFKSLNSLPIPLTSFVGRVSALIKIKEWIQDSSSRLLSLTGAPGTGKTRLAIQAVSGLINEFKDGVIYVPLDHINNPECVPAEIAKILRIQDIKGQSVIDRLKSIFKNKQVLLILDNFEQVIQAAPLLVELLENAPGVKILVTSREVLRVSGEQEFHVSPLELPDEEVDESFTSLMENESILLFLQRCQAVQPDVCLSDANAITFKQIVKKLDGLPLAIELAAPQIRLFSPQALLKRLDKSFEILMSGMRDMPPRHQTLKATIDWSFDLLEPEEQSLFIRLAVFRNSWTVEAVESICCPDLHISAVNGLELLLNKNLIKLREDPGEERRFTFLRSIHDYAQEKLEQSGFAIDYRDKHSKYYTSLVQAAEPYTRAGAKQLWWLQRLEKEYNNLQAALEWTLEGGGDPLDGLIIVGSLGYFWFRKGHYYDVQKWVPKAFEKSGRESIAVRAALHRTKALMNIHATEPLLKIENMNEALSLYEQLDDRYEMGWVLTNLSMYYAEQQKKFDKAFTMCERGLSLLEEVGDLPGVAQAFNILGELKRLHGDLEPAEKAYKKSLNLSIEIGDKLREAIQYINLGFIYFRQGKNKLARQMFSQSATLALAIEHKPCISCALHAMAGPLGLQGNPTLAARLFGAADLLNEELGITIQPSDIQELINIKNLIREKLGEETFTKTVEEGKLLNFREAVQLALKESVKQQH
jgi:predicted ATPase/DNA-binding CsgD family transcriptional regulator